MANETRLDTIVTTGGTIRVVEGVTGLGIENRRATLEAIPEQGYRFDGWTITKTLPFYVAGVGPYESPTDACNGTGLANVDVYLLYVSGNKLFIDNEGETEAPIGYYQLVSAANGYRPDPNTYIEYFGNIVPVPAICPPPTDVGSGGPI